MAMKATALIITLVFVFGPGFLIMAQNSDGDNTEPHHHTLYPEGSAQDKQINELIQAESNIPIEALPVFYIVDPTNAKLSPAYVRYVDGLSSECIYYVWKGVGLERKQIPVSQTGMRSLGVVDVSKFPNIRIHQIIPPCYYYKVPGSDRYAVGYFDTNQNIFYAWKGVELNKSELPADAVPGRILRIEAPSYKGRVDIDAVVLIDPPKA